MSRDRRPYLRLRQANPTPSGQDRVRRPTGQTRTVADWVAKTSRRATLSSAPIPEAEATSSVLRRDLFYRWSLAVADLASATLALVAAVELLPEGSLRIEAALALVLIVFLNKSLGTYDRDEYVLKKTTLDEAPRVLIVAILWTLLLWLGEQLAIGASMSKSLVISLMALVFVASMVARLIARWVARRATKPERCLVMGAAEDVAWIRNKLQSQHNLAATYVGQVPLEQRLEVVEQSPQPDDFLGSRDELGIVLAEHDVDRVIIAPRDAASDLILGAVRLIKSLGVKVSIVPRLFEVLGSSVEFDEIDGTTVLGMRRYGLSPSSRAIKRAADLAGALLLLVVTVPLWTVIAIAIKVTSPGPVFFRQPRGGKMGEQFTMFKFRTMQLDADQQQATLLALNEADGFFKMANDPRVTPVGRVLRRSSLDELPQLLNVLRGDMSLVGPRPLPIAEDRRIEGWERTRLNVRPGMTGLWQIFGSARIPMSDMVKIDYLYGANWSLWLDAKILIRTVPYVVGRRGM